MRDGARVAKAGALLLSRAGPVFTATPINTTEKANTSSTEGSSSFPWN